MVLREIRSGDFEALMALYLHLHETGAPERDERAETVWQGILRDDNYHIIVTEKNGQLVSSCTCVIVPNLTRGLRPYALIENVVTHADWRGRGWASACLRRAEEIAARENCYKIMLLTGAKDEKTLSFYEKAGYDRTGKTAFVKMLPLKQ